MGDTGRVLFREEQQFLQPWLWALLGPLCLMGIGIFLYGIIDAFLKKVPAPDNPWGSGATTLEWQLSSPPPFHQWEVLPRIGDTKH